MNFEEAILQAIREDRAQVLMLETGSDRRLSATRHAARTASLANRGCS
jgi:hypothetical protein